MSAGLIGILSIGVAAAALIASRIHSLRGVMRMDLRDLRDTPEIFFGAPGQPLTEAVGQLAVSMSERTRAPEGAEADRSPKQESHHVPDSRGGTIYDPRPPEDKARRRIAYLLIALLALLIIALLAMVVFGIITVGDIKEFGAILGPLVALVSAATGFYYATKR